MKLAAFSVPRPVVEAANLTHGQFRLYCALGLLTPDEDGWATLRKPYLNLPFSAESVDTQLNHLARLGYIEQKLIVLGMRVRVPSAGELYARLGYVSR